MYIDIHNTDKQYDIIYADPPWSYNDKLGGRSDMGATPYPQMSQDELNALPVCQLAKKDSILFMWATMPKLQEALDTIKAYSAKPKEVRDRIVALMGDDKTKIELFAREYADGWDCWGNEV